ncbi:hypothetical protein PPL_01545 [Heterostelium album PN500]|uniref:Uncharacterized protein n=1 Tax=Heterostelium pallidum (strain ATCC 26659 / Pp 5 / PN500) TaxID=670386 RepID=D3AZT2_HETP5|nr:hypothetical protein PPL_01545 [Heterostelium album PN500]EFA84556.1 hypothetical protein PPL_01545 [Heterostelium album PN500]|eukprot:XP_020436669.1 hypothetical protein PPL_01545 [Heterostelium album PN500]
MKKCVLCRSNNQKQQQQQQQQQQQHETTNISEATTINTIAINQQP